MGAPGDAHSRRLKQDPSALRERPMQGFGRVAVLLGGDSTEREISLLSGNAVLAGLKRSGVDAHAFDPRDEALATLLSERFDRCDCPARSGWRSGTLQGAPNISACRTRAAV